MERAGDALPHMLLFLVEGGLVCRGWDEVCGDYRVQAEPSGKRGETLSVFTWRTFNCERPIFFRLIIRTANLQEFVPRTDSALILFDLKCHFLKRTYVSNKNSAAIN